MWGWGAHVGAGMCHGHSLTAPKQLQQEEEDVDNVHVEAECTEHMLLRAQGVPPIPHQELHVEGQELQWGQAPGQGQPGPTQ